MNGDRRFKFHADKVPWTEDIELRCGYEIEGQGWELAQPLTFAVQPRGNFVAPFLTIPIEAAQKLMDELYNIGLRPSREVGSHGQLEAIKYHLEDLRKLSGLLT